MSRRYGTYTTTCDVEIDISDVMNEMDNDEIIEECKKRGIVTSDDAKEDNAERAELWRDFADDLRAGATDKMHLEVLIIRMLAMAHVPRLSIPAKA